MCLMDEPMSNLDAKLRNEMRAEIQALQRQLGITMLYVTHDQIEAMSMADQVVLLSRGPDRAGGAAGGDVLAAGRRSSPRSSSASRAMNLLELEPTPKGAAIAGSQGAALVPRAAPGMVAGVRARGRRARRARRLRGDASSRRNTSAPTRCCAAGSAPSRCSYAPAARFPRRSATRCGCRGRTMHCTCSTNQWTSRGAGDARPGPANRTPNDRDQRAQTRR